MALTLPGGYTVAQVRKTVEAVVGLVLVVGTAIATSVTDAPAWFTTVLTTVLAVATAVRVFLAQNAPVIDAYDRVVPTVTPDVVAQTLGKHASPDA